MLFYAAAQRLDRKARRARIADFGASTHGGDFLKRLLTTLRD